MEERWREREVDDIEGNLSTDDGNFSNEAMFIDPNPNPITSIISSHQSGSFLNNLSIYPTHLSFNRLLRRLSMFSDQLRPRRFTLSFPSQTKISHCYCGIKMKRH